MIDKTKNTDIDENTNENANKIQTEIKIQMR